MPDVARALHTVHFHSVQHVRRADDGTHGSLAIIIPSIIIGSLFIALCLYVSAGEWLPSLTRIFFRQPVAANDSASSASTKISTTERKVASEAEV